RIVACPPKDNMPGSSSPSGFLISAALSPDGKTIATSYSDTVRNFLGAAKEDGSKTDELIRLHDVATGKELAALKARSRLIMALAFSANGRHLTSRDGTGTVRVWDWRGAKEVASFASRGADAPQHGYDDYNVDDFLAHSPDG